MYYKTEFFFYLDLSERLFLSVST